MSELNDENSKKFMLSVIAFCVGLFGAIAVSFGKILFKYWKDHPNRCKRWTPEMIIVASNITDIFTTGVLPLPISSMFSGLPIILSQLANRLLLKTQMSKIQWMLTVLAFGAIAGIVLSSSLENPTAKDPALVFHSQVFEAVWPIIFLVLPILLASTGALYLRQFEEKQLESSLTFAVLGSAIGTSLYILNQIFIKISWNVLFGAKPSDAYYAFLGIIPVLALIQLKYVGFMWRTLNVTYVLPLYQSFNVVSGTLGGIILFREYPSWVISFTLSVLALVAINCAFLFCGDSASVSARRCGSIGTPVVEISIATVISNEADADSKAGMCSISIDESEDKPTAI